MNWLNKAWRGFLWTLLAGIVVAVAAAQYFYACVDDEIRTRATKLLAECLPDHNVHIRLARLVEGEGIELRGITASPKTGGGKSPICEIQEVFLCCATDVSDLVGGKLQYKRVLIRRPQFRLVRLPDGSWDLPRFQRPAQQTNQPLPEIEVQDGLLELVDTSKAVPSTWTFRELAVKLTPTWLQPAAEQPAVLGLQAEARMRGDYLRTITLQGTWLLEPGRGTASAQIDGLSLGPELLAALPVSLPAELANIPEIRAETDANIEVSYAPQRDRPLLFRMDVEVQRGVVSDSRFGLPLRDLQAKLSATQDGLVLHELVAHQAEASLTAKGQTWGWQWPFRCQLQTSAKQVVFDKRWVPHLPANVQKWYGEYAPEGRFDLVAAVTFDGEEWLPDLRLDCQDLAFTYFRFPYRFDRGYGSLDLRQKQLHVNLMARVGNEPVKITGKVLNPGPDAQVSLTAVGENLRSDSRLLQALPPKVCAAVQGLDPQLTFDSIFEVQRAAGPNQIVQLHALGKIRDGTVRSIHFPYTMSKVRGTIEGHGETQNQPDGTSHFRWRWTFRDLVGHNDTGVVRCHGRLDPPDEGGVLHLHFVGTEIELDAELRDALPPRLLPVWSELQPEGMVHVLASLHLTPGEPPAIEVRVEPQGASILPAHFPYRLEELEGALTYANNLVQLEHMRAKHGAVNLTSEGQCTIDPEGGWTLDLQDFSAERIRLDRDTGDRDLQRALPAQLRTILDPLQLSGTVSLHGAMRIVGRNEPPGTLETSWDLNMECRRVGIEQPIPFRNIYGGVQLRGSHSNEQFTCVSELDLDAAEFQQFHLTQIRGPVSCDGKGLTFGAREAFLQTRPGQPLPPGARHVTARLFGGTVVIDTIATLTEPVKYQVRGALVNADLAQYALEWLPGEQNLRGRVSAQIALSGSGTGTHNLQGKGQASLREGNIYELPVMLNMLKLNSLTAGDSSAFSEGDMGFRVEGPFVYFDDVRFRGDLLSLRGNGSMNLDGAIQFKFYTIMGRDRLQLPVLEQVVGSASQQLLMINVDGTLDKPEMRRELVPVVTEALQQIRGDLQGKPVAGPPRGSSFPTGRRLLNWTPK